MAVTRFSDPEPQFVSANGLPLVAGTLTFYEPGSLVLKNTYPTEADAEAETNPNANPMTLTSFGAAPTEVWLNGEYRAILKTSLGAVIWDLDPVVGTPGNNLPGMQAVSSIATLRTTEAGADGQMILVTGYYEAGDAPSRTCVWDAASTATDDGGRIFQVTGVPVGRWKSTIVDHMDIRLWGAKLDNTTDDWDAWNRAINSAIRTDAVFFSGPHCGTIIFPEGISYVSQLLEWHAYGTIRGGGSHIVNAHSCIIRNPANVGGFQFNSHNTTGNTTKADGGSAAGSTIEGISFQGGYYPGAVGTVGRGIRARAQCRIINCNVQGYAQEGVYIQASAGTGGATEGNCNLSSVQDVRVQNCGSHGFYVDGADANASLFLRCDASANGGYGIYESSFLGNTWVQPHCDSNTLKNYKADNVNTNAVWVNPYSEGAGPEEFDQANLILGSQIVLDATKAGVQMFANAGTLHVKKAVSVNVVDGAATMAANLGGDPTLRTIWSFTSSVYAPLTWRQRLLADDMVMDYAAGGGTYPWLITGPGTALAFGRAAAVPYAFASDRLFTAANSGGRHITHGAAAPVAGAHGVGDIVFNNGATAGGKVGWVCVTAGTPGTWKTFGDITA